LLSLRVRNCQQSPFSLSPFLFLKAGGNPVLFIFSYRLSPRFPPSGPVCHCPLSLACVSTISPLLCSPPAPRTAATVSLLISGLLVGVAGAVRPRRRSYLVIVLIGGRSPRPGRRRRLVDPLARVSITALAFGVTRLRGTLRPYSARLCRACSRFSFLRLHLPVLIATWSRPAADGLVSHGRHLNPLCVPDRGLFAYLFHLGLGRDALWRVFAVGESA